VKFSRRDLLQGVSTVALVAGLPTEKAKAWIHGSVGAPTGKNQIGLNGLNYFSNQFPLSNWYTQGDPSLQLQVFYPVTAANLTWSGGTATIVTTNPHGLYNGSSSVSGWNCQITCSGNAAFNKSGAVFTVTGASTLTYAIASNPGTASGTITFLTNLFGSIPSNGASSLFGVNNNVTQFVDANYNLQPNITGASQISLFRVVYGLDSSNGAVIPPGFSRAGTNNFTVAWTGGATATFGGANSPVTYSWTSGNDGGTFTLQILNITPSDPPTNIYFGLTSNYTAWQTGNWFDATYKNSVIKPAAGVIRFMDWLQTNSSISFNQYSKYPSTASMGWAGNTGNTTAYPFKAGFPIAAAAQLCNQTNKHPWLCVPIGFANSKSCNVVSIASAGTNLTTITLGSGGVAGPHPFVVNDLIIPNDVGGNGTSNSGWGQQATVTFNVASNYVTWVSNAFVAGQSVWFTGGTLPSNIFGVQTYYVCNVGVAGAGTFQLAISLANALVPTPITFTGSSSGTITGTSNLNRQLFTISATTTTSITIQYCDSSAFGGSLPGAQGEIITPLNLTNLTNEVTNWITDVKNNLNSQIVPRIEYGNELWNTLNDKQAYLYSLSHPFVDGSGNQIFSGDNSYSMSGYIMAHVMFTIRGVYGGRSKWYGIIPTQGGNAGVTSQVITGIQYYLNNYAPASGLTINDLFNGICAAGYYSGFIQPNGFGANGNWPGVTFTTGANSQVNIGAGTNTRHVGIPIMFGTTGTLPTDSATGQPLVRGDSNPQYSLTCSITAGVMTVTSITGTPLAVGMTIWPNMGSVSRNGILPTVIQSLGTGAGGTGTYNMDINQTSTGSFTGTAQDITSGNGVYWMTSTGNNFTFSSTQGGANINLSDTGSGTHYCKTGYATWLLAQMAQSISLHASSPGTYPSRYTFFNQAINNEALYGTSMGMQIGGPVLGTSSPYAVPSLMTGTFLPIVPYLSGTGPTYSNLDLLMYEGAQNNPAQPNATVPNGVACWGNPAFQEFWPTAINTNEDANNWTQMVASWRAFGTAQSINVGPPSKFVDAINITWKFGFGSLYFFDPVAGIGSPNWQNSLNQHPVFDAVVGTN
jgi:hypothetical protein